MIAYYKNSRGETINFMRFPYRTVEADWFDASWEEENGGYETKMSIDVFGDRAEFKNNMESLYQIIAVDAEEDTYGRLYVNDTFLRCRIKTSEKSGWKGYIYSEVELIFTAPVLSWVREKRKSFAVRQNTTSNGLNFPFNFPFNFASSQKGQASWKIEHPAPSEFQMIVYGPCVNPRVLIDGYPYEVFTTLDVGDYMIIDSQSDTVYKYLSNGTIQNLFHNRGLEYSIFEKIPSGLLNINWSGDFGFDLTLFLERREAAW